MTCKDCISYDVCKYHAEQWKADGYKVKFDTSLEAEKECKAFKDKSRYIELPCKVGDMVYYIPFGNYIIQYKVARISIEPFAEIGMSFFCYGGITFDMRDIGKTAFFTREKAEKALAERSKQ